MPDFDDSGPPSDRELTDQYRRTMYEKVDQIQHTVAGFAAMATRLLFVLIVFLAWIAYKVA